MEGVGTLGVEEASETRVSKEDVVEEEEEEAMEEVNIPVDQGVQTLGTMEKVTKGFLKTEGVEEEEDMVGLAVVLHLNFACNGILLHKRIVFLFLFCTFSILFACRYLRVEFDSSICFLGRFFILSFKSSLEPFFINIQFHKSPL